MIYTLVKIRCSCVAFEKELLVYPYVHVVALFQNAPCCNEFFLRVGYLRISAEPVERFFLQNCKEDYPEHGEQYLSESYKVKQENPALELKVDIYNINYEKAPEIIARSKSLNDYSLFVHTVKMGVQSGRTFDEAVEDAVVYCIRNNIMKEFLELHGSEVSNMLLSEWNMDEALEVTQEEAFADGVEYGLAAEREKNIRALRRKLSAEDIAETLEVPLE